MNIKRFEHINENSNINWKEKFKRHYDLKIEVEKEFEDIYNDARPLLTMFLETREDFDEIDIEDIYVKSFEYYPNSPYLKFRIEYFFADDPEEIFYDLDEEEFDDLLEFLKDPELYINSNNYNI
jgi:hypothetical protein